MVRSNVCSRVTDRNGSVTPATNVFLHISNDSFDIWSTIGVVHIVDDFITGEESKSIGVIGELVNSGKDGLKVNTVVRFFGFVSVERVERGIGIEDKIDTSISEISHALVVVRSVVDSVNSDCIDS